MGQCVQDRLSTLGVIHLRQLLGYVEIVPADDAVLDKPIARFGHFLFLFFRLQKLTRIPYRHRPRETVYMFDSIEHSFDGDTQRRLVDHTQDEMTLQYLSEGFEGLIESVLFRVGVEPPKEIGGGRLLEFDRGDEA